MGIHGLTSFVDNNSHLLKDHKLHDCRVVIDANNFYHFLYFNCNVRFQFGGDYDVFRRKIAMIFSSFKSCNIEAFLVFDGAYTVDGKKFRTTISRAEDRVHAAQRIMYGHRGTLIPCLAQQAFRQTLDELGIQHVTCDFEADNQLATLANQWNCPVISNDSDFYIFELYGGFIPLDYIDFRLRQSPDTSGAFLPVQYYHVDEFIKCFKSLNRAVLPLFATMLGNDYINAAAFEAFYRKKTPKIASRRYSASKKHQKIVSVLYWLEDRAQKEELVSEVLTFIRPEQKTKVETILRNSISGYRDTQDFESFDLKKFFEGDRAVVKEKTDFVTSAWGKCLPAWFVAACRCGDIPASLLNVALVHCIILQIQVERRHLPASFVTSTAIREVVYGLLFGKTQEDQPHETGPQETESDVVQTHPLDAAAPQPCNIQYQGRASSESDQASSSGDTVKSSANFLRGKHRDAAEGVLEYTRHNTQLRRNAVQPRITLPMFGKLPALERIDSLSEGDRRAIFLETLGVTAGFTSKFDPHLQLYMACLVFWARNAEPSVTLHHLKGVVLSALLLQVHKEIADREHQALNASAAENWVTGKHADVLHQAGNVMQGAIVCANGSSSVKVGQAPSAFGDAIPQQPAGIQGDGVRDNEPFTSEKKTRSCSPEISIAYVCTSADDRMLEKVRDNLKKYYNDPVSISKKVHPDHETFHSTAQFQACLHDADQLNRLLQRPFPTLQPAALINGSFVYTIIHEMQVRSNPEMFLSEMLVKGSAFTALFHSLWSEVVAEAGEAAFAQVSCQGSKVCKSTKKKLKKAMDTELQQSNQNSYDMVLPEGGEEGQFMVANCDLSNRFGALMMGEDME